jgi:hypothetical protein
MLECLIYDTVDVVRMLQVYEIQGEVFKKDEIQKVANKRCRRSSA